MAGVNAFYITGITDHYMVGWGFLYGRHGCIVYLDSDLQVLLNFIADIAVLCCRYCVIAALPCVLWQHRQVHYGRITECIVAA